jgi:hypothetical protein
MAHSLDHAANLRRVLLFDGMPDPFQAKRLDGRELLELCPIRAFD